MICFMSHAETPPPAYMSEDGGSPRPDPNSMDADAAIPPGKTISLSTN